MGYVCGQEGQKTHKFKKHVVIPVGPSSNQHRCRVKKVRHQLGSLSRTNNPDGAGVSEKIRRVFSKHDIPAHFRPSHTLTHNPVHPKHKLTTQCVL